MIQLHPDYLMVKTSTGEMIPCSAETVTVELIGASTLDPEMVQNVAGAVVHYFKNDLKKTIVSVAEFSIALERVLRAFGFDVETNDPPDEPGVARIDLPQLVQAGGHADLELMFFPALRGQLQKRLKDGPTVVRFEGLRPCVKEIVGAKRWNLRCQELSDQIVAYLRTCFKCESTQASCQLVVR